MNTDNHTQMQMQIQTPVEMQTQNYGTIFQQQKSRLIHLLFSYKFIVLLSILFMILNMWLFNHEILQKNILPSALSIRIVSLMLAFAPLFLIAFYFNLFCKNLRGLSNFKNFKNPDIDMDLDMDQTQIQTQIQTQKNQADLMHIFQKINKLLQISLIILHFYLFWVIIKVEDLLVAFFKSDASNIQNTALKITHDINLGLLCIGLIYLYFVHLAYLSPFKKYQKMLKKAEKAKKAENVK